MRHQQSSRYPLDKAFRFHDQGSTNQRHKIDNPYYWIEVFVQEDMEHYLFQHMDMMCYRLVRFLKMILEITFSGTFLWFFLQNERKNLSLSGQLITSRTRTSSHTRILSPGA